MTGHFEDIKKFFSVCPNFFVKLLKTNKTFFAFCCSFLCCLVMFLIRSHALHVRAYVRAYACAQSILPQEKLLDVPDSFLVANDSQ
jgi:hypothetical protein